jgi:hypothetical protein
MFAAVLDALIALDGHRAFHIKDVPGLPKGRDSEDEDWIRRLHQDDLRWIFLSGDSRVVKNPATRAALRSSGLHGFILAPAYQKTPLNRVAAVLLWKWPEIEKITALLAPPSMHEIPIKKMSKLRSLPL